MFVPPPVPEKAPPLQAALDADGVVYLQWDQSAETIGLEAELHRGAEPGFAPDSGTKLVRTELARYPDRDAAAGTQHYALLLASNGCEANPHD
jgi:hypothetical protein